MKDEIFFVSKFISFIAVLTIFFIIIEILINGYKHFRYDINRKYYMVT